MSNPNIPEVCRGCGKRILLENLFVDDGCPCNTPRGVNFQPKPCGPCRADNCVKPGHRLAELFGEAVAAFACIHRMTEPCAACAFVAREP